MTDVSVHRWLIQLCDPAGYTQLPAQRLDLSQIRRLLTLADEHGVTGAVLANLQHLLATAGRQRLTNSATTMADPAGLAAELEAARQRWLAS